MKRVVAASFVALPLLVACGSTGPEAAAPPPLASLLATPTPTPTPPPQSVVQAAVRAYIDGVNKAFRTGDTSAALKASTPTCKCRDQLKGISDVYAKGEHFVGTHIVVVHIAEGNATATTADARLTFRAPASAIANAAGKSRPLKAQPARTVTATVSEVAGKWLVSTLTGLPTVGPAAGPTTRPSARPSSSKPTPQPTPSSPRPSPSPTP